MGHSPDINVVLQGYMYSRGLLACKTGCFYAHGRQRCLPGHPSEFSTTETVLSECDLHRTLLSLLSSFRKWCPPLTSRMSPRLVSLSPLITAEDHIFTLSISNGINVSHLTCFFAPGRYCPHGRAYRPHRNVVSTLRFDFGVCHQAALLGAPSLSSWDLYRRGLGKLWRRPLVKYPILSSPHI